jgi:hypothetical protein
MSKLDNNSVRKIVTSYNKIQEAKLSVESILAKNESIQIIDQMLDTLSSIDKLVKRPLTNYIGDSEVGQWAMSQYGMGPVLTAGLMSHIDITKANTAGAIWRYAGLDPHASESGKVAYNGELKNICWKIGLNFAKYANRSQCFYGKFYLQDLARRTESNNNFEYADRAQSIALNVDSKNKTNVALLSSGKLPQDQIDAQARRFAVKIFLSHYHAVAYQEHYGIEPDRPSIIYIDGTEQRISIPNNPF